MKRFAAFGLLACTVFGVLAPVGLVAQEPRAQLPIIIPVGSELENYLRYLALDDTNLAKQPWSIRGFSPAQLARLAPGPKPHPWASMLGGQTSGSSSRPRLEFAPSSATLWYNSGFPYGTNDGPQWRGRGFTGALQLGVSFEYGPVSAIVAPVGFYSENRPFELMPAGGTGNQVYSDPTSPGAIDRPQRFGDKPYMGLDLGSSTLQVAGGPLALGISTANTWWGPMTEFPFILGNNAAGFEHIFVGSATPWNVGIGRVHGQVIYGNLQQSAFASDTGLLAKRFASGLIGVFMPRGVPNLELGVARFYHTPARQGGPTRRDLLKPFESFLKQNIRTGGDAIPGDLTTDRDNELASAFFRWVLPSSGFEVYGEFGREDHSGDQRDLLLEPDHSASFGLGLGKVWSRADQVIGLRAEVMDIDPSLLNVVRPEGSTYTHTYLVQGHTQRGQLLGAGFGSYGGSAAKIAIERYTLGGHSVISLSRAVVRESNLGRIGGYARDQDVQYAISLNDSRFRRNIEIGWKIDAIYELNRNLLRDTAALGAGLTVTWW